MWVEGTGPLSFGNKERPYLLRFLKGTPSLSMEDARDLDNTPIRSGFLKLFTQLELGDDGLECADAGHSPLVTIPLNVEIGLEFDGYRAKRESHTNCLHVLVKVFRAHQAVLTKEFVTHSGLLVEAEPKARNTDKCETANVANVMLVV